METVAEFRNQFWCALRVKPRYEKTTALASRANRFEEFLRRMVRPSCFNHAGRSASEVSITVGLVLMVMVLVAIDR